MNAEQRQALVDVLVILGQAIREAGEIPSGHLYAMLMGKMGLNTYTQMITLLKKQGLVSEEYHLLKWVGGDRGVEIKTSKEAAL